MSRVIPPKKHPTIEAVQHRFEQWRRNRSSRGPIPEELWDAAVNLTEGHSFHRVSRSLRLNQTALKERVARHGIEPSPVCGARQEFVEVAMGEGVWSGVEWTLEMEDARGVTMRIVMKGINSSEVGEMAKGLWGARR